MMKNVFGAALMAAVSMAMYSETPHEETTEEISKYDDMCYHCIDEGNLFCSSDGISGKCYAASCTQDELVGEAKRAAKGFCTLRAHACNEAEAGNKVARTAYSQCAPKVAQDTEKCPERIELTGKVINSGGEEYTDESTLETAYRPYTQAFTIPAKGHCFTTISVPEEPVAFKNKAGTTGAWSATEWEDVTVMMTKLTGAEAYTESNSAMYSKETYFYNNVDAKAGNIAGRVPVEAGTSWRLLMLNYEEEEQGIVIVYGGAVHSMLTYTGLALSLVFTAFAF